MVTLKELEPELTAEEKREIEAAENRIPVSDEDCPEMTIEQLGQFRRMESEVTVKRKAITQFQIQRSKTAQYPMK